MAPVFKSSHGWFVQCLICLYTVEGRGLPMPNLEDDDQDHDGAGEFSFYLNKTIIWIHTNKQTGTE